jgi:transcriptional regulator with XRE-family HTH domain
VDKKQHIISLRMEGWTYRRIAQDFGISKQRVCQICKSSDIPRKLSAKDLQRLSVKETKITKSELNEVFLKDCNDFELSNFFLFSLGYTDKQIAIRKKCCLDDIESSRTKMRSITDHADIISVIQELFS